MARRRVDQAAIADLLGISRAAVSDRLRGRTKFKVEELVAIGRHLDTKLDKLLGDIDESEAASA